MATGKEQLKKQPGLIILFWLTIWCQEFGEQIHLLKISCHFFPFYFLNRNHCDQLNKNESQRQLAHNTAALVTVEVAYHILEEEDFTLFDSISSDIGFCLLPNLQQILNKYCLKNIFDTTFNIVTEILYLQSQTRGKSKKRWSGGVRKLHPHPAQLTGECMHAATSFVYNSLQPHGLQPARLLCPCDSQARILKWVAEPSSRGSSWPRDQTHVSYIDLHWQAASLPLAPPGKPYSRAVPCLPVLNFWPSKWDFTLVPCPSLQRSLKPSDVISI